MNARGGGKMQWVAHYKAAEWLMCMVDNLHHRRDEGLSVCYMTPGPHLQIPVCQTARADQPVIEDREVAVLFNRQNGAFASVKHISEHRESRSSPTRGQK